MNSTAEDFQIQLKAVDDDNGLVLRKTCVKLIELGSLLDCTLCCLDGQVQAHRIVLASASSYLMNLFTTSPTPGPGTHPVLFLRNSTVADTKNALEFIYTGKTLATKAKIPALIEIASELGLIGLRLSIENGVQSCGVEIFRRQLTSKNGGPIRATVSTDSNSSTTATASISSAAKEVTDEIMIKNEPPDSIDENESSSSEGLEKNGGDLIIAENTGGLKKPSMISHTQDAIKNSESEILSDVRQKTSDVQWMGREHGNEDVSNGSGNGQFTFDHEKGESFVYTNEDLNLCDPDARNENSTADGSTSNNLFSTKGQLSLFGISESFNSRNSGRQSQKSNVNLGTVSEEVPASCPWCMQVFTSLTLLQRHIKTHVNNYRPFTCEYCHNTFARSAHLKRHLRTHTGEKPYQCNICDRPFARQDKLKIHLERHVQQKTALANADLSVLNATKNTTQTSGSSGTTNSQMPIKIIMPSGGTATVTSSSNNSTGYKLNETNVPITTAGLSAKHVANGLSISFAGSSDSKLQTMNGKTSWGATTITPITNANTFNAPEKPTISTTVVNQKGFVNAASR